MANISSHGSVKQYYAHVARARADASMTYPRSIHSPKVPGRKASVVALLLLWTALTPICLSAQQDQPQTVAPQQVPPTPAPSFDLSDEVVRDVLTNFQRAIETRTFDRLLDTFDRDSMKDFPEVRDQFAAFFNLHDNIKFRYQLLQATADKGIAFATADIDMEAQPADDLPTEQRRSTQMRFQMKQTPKGWRIIGIKPMDFFSK
jgi:ketosteroid isomerase-like protein